MRNVFKGKNLTHLLYGILMLLPFCSILARVIYVQSNQNAKDSYYGQNINEQIPVQGYNDLQTYYNYQFGLPSVDSGNITYNVTNVKVIVPPTNYNFNQDFDNNIKEIYVYYSNGIHYTRVKFNDDTYQYVQNLNTSFQSMVLGFYLLSKPTNELFSNYISYMTYNQNSYLDNVFDYSISNFIEDNNYNIDFFGWFNNLFLNQSGKNLLYLNFVNWYLNYALLVSAGYILFLLFLWFINFARKLLEGGNSFGHGGF